MLQRQIFFKQLQEMQRQQQLQELSDCLNKQTSAGLQAPLINGMPVHDASQMYMIDTHLTQRGTSSIIQGVPNGLVFSQAQNQDSYSAGVLSQQFDASSFGTLSASSGNNMNPYSRVQGAYLDSSNMLNRGNNSQLEIRVMQPSNVSNSIVNEQFNASSHKACISDGNFVSKHVFEDKNMVGQLLVQASDDGVLPANSQQLHSLQRSTTMKQSGMNQEQAGYPVFSPGKTSNSPSSQCATSLDPLEERILFNTDDNIWKSSLGGQDNGGLGGFVSTGGYCMGTFSSNQSGSWSALMQSAVAEASSSDTGQQEEWSGLTFQNTELSADNQHRIGDGKPSSWVDNNLQSISSPISKPEVPLQSPKANYGFATFQESGRLVVSQNVGMRTDSSHESVQQLPKNASNWFDETLQQKQTIEGRQLVQTPHHSQNAWHNQQSENFKNDGRQPSISPYITSSQSGNNLTGHELKANKWLYESGPQPMLGRSQRPRDQMHPADFQGNSRASEELPPSNNVDIIAPICDNSAEFSACLNMQANTSFMNASGLLYINNQLKNEHELVTPLASQSPHATLAAITGIFQGQEFPTLETMPITQPFLKSGMPQQIGISMGPSNLSRDVSSQPGAQSKVPNVFSNALASPDSANSNVDTTRGSLHEQYEQNASQNEDTSKAINARTQITQAYDCEEDQLNSSGASTPFKHNRLVHGHAASGNHLSGANAVTSVSMITSNTVDHKDNTTPNISGRDLDAFGCSLRHRVIEQSFPLFHQQVNANARQQLFYGLKSGVTNLARSDSNPKSQLNSISSWEDKSMTYLSESSGNQLVKHSSKVFTPDGGMLVSGENDTHSHSKEHSQINVQMAPSWFEHYGTTKNEQMLPMYDLMCRKDAARQFSVGKSFETFPVVNSIGRVNSSNASQPSSILPNSATQIVAHQLSPACLIPFDQTEQNLAILRPKKRKVSSFDIIPWHKEVTQVSQQLQKVSSIAESEWAISSNRISERVEDEAEMFDNVLPMSRAKKRLALTTQLMQQVFRPAPAAIFSADAWSNSESMVCFVARLALGDACSMTSGFKEPFLTSDMSSKNLGMSEKAGQLDFSEAVEKFIDRAKRLENDLLRMDKTTSIVDIKVDSQELERFSVINRFAKFHSRGHLVSVNASLGSSGNPAVLKASAQRYVVAHPMPKVVPEGINCISL